MPIFEQGDVVRVPFPYTDRDTRQRRPALVVSNGPIGENAALLWVVMITSAENRPWLGDVRIPDHLKAGLPAPSVVRPVKIVTVEAKHVEAVGKVSRQVLDEVLREANAVIGLTTR
ncbi:type II toxin-antitoxin system PemK/MazF family toxin [Rhizobium sp. LC145]|uniref:type II toxin-antitoxin system PemK/MazF family toxin n=1 Tax=Rhizobium sp. LC145 TaxID=1120688 RepID=UPI00062A0437|nr:type II toxin-antitoxin system PemK/MazF family toxin [Rhizobium sp. LC145]KKX34171.1 growth inhibitor PemK [Rhizobium sp. LC145]TKT55451.1 type II toxin-antitoxin system PemK/MazF family toxin [Rhizobiaceae bacterium LC148]